MATEYSQGVIRRLPVKQSPQDLSDDDWLNDIVASKNEADRDLGVSSDAYLEDDDSKDEDYEDEPDEEEEDYNPGYAHLFNKTADSRTADAHTSSTPEDQTTPIQQTSQNKHQAETPVARTAVSEPEPPRTHRRQTAVNRSEAEEAVDPIAEIVAESSPEPPKRKRGRPRKSKDLPNGIKEMIDSVAAGQTTNLQTTDNEIQTDNSSPTVENHPPKTKMNAAPQMSEVPRTAEPQMLSLYDWIASHDLQSGIRWARITRLHPVEFVNNGRSIPISGIQKDHIYHAFDEDWIASTYGGASWIVEVWGIDPSKGSGPAKRIGYRTVTISGDPIAYRSGSEDRVMLETDDDEDDYGPPMPRGRRGFGPQTYGPQNGPNGRFPPPQSPWGPSPAGPWPTQQSPAQNTSLVDLTREFLRSKQRQQEDVEVTKLVKDMAEKAAEGQVSTIREQMADLRRLAADASTQASRPAELIAETTKTQMQMQTASLTAQIEAERNMRQREAEAMRADHARQIEMLRNEATRNLELLKNGYDLQLRAAEDRLRAAEARSVSADERVGREIDRERTNAQREIDRIRADHARDLDRMKEIYSTKGDQAEGYLKTQLSVAQSEVDRLRNEIKDMRSENLVLREKANPDAKTQIAHVKDLISLSREITGDDEEEDDTGSMTEDDHEANMAPWERVLRYAARSPVAQSVAQRLTNALQPQQAPPPPMGFMPPGIMPQIPMAPVPQIPAPPMLPQMPPTPEIYVQPPAPDLPPGFTPVVPQQQPGVVSQQPVIPETAPPTTIDPSMIVEGLRPIVPMIEAAITGGIDPNAYADQAVTVLPPAELQALAALPVDVVISAVEAINPNGVLATANGSRFLRTLFKRIVQVARGGR